MANNFLSKLFNKNNKNNKNKKIISKLKKTKKEYDVLDKKLMNGNISKKELDQYYSLKEEIKKMAKKFVLKDGKFVLKTNDKKNIKDKDIENKQDNINKKQAQAKQQLSPEQINQIKAQQQAQLRAQQQAQNNANSSSLKTVYLVVSDLPEFSLKIKKDDVLEFKASINKAMTEGIPFKFGPAIINGSKILMYRFE